MGLLDGKVALITGGSRGIGKAIALKFASEGADVAFTATRINEETLAEISAFGTKVRAYASDASDFTQAHELVKQVHEEFGRIDILVNNAGITRDTLMLRMTEQQWDDVLSTNLKSAFNYSHAVLPVMARQRSGSIINMSSIIGLHGNPGQANYAASKAGLVGMSMCLAKEYGARGIRVNCIAPGFIETDMTAAMPEELRELYVKDIPMKRAGKPEEVAGVALFLASDMSAYVSGQTIGCCGALGL